MSRTKQRIIITILLLATSLRIVACNNAPPSPLEEVSGSAPSSEKNEVRVHQYENEAALNFQYSTDWTVAIPQQNLIVTGPSETIIGDEPGPLVAILRVPVFQVHGNLEGEFNHYLDFGPKRDGYEVVEDITDFELDGRPAKQIRLTFEGNSDEDEIAQEAWVVGAEAENGAVYIISLTAPPEDWVEDQILLKLLVQSIKFNE